MRQGLLRVSSARQLHVSGLDLPAMVRWLAEVRHGKDVRKAIAQDKWLKLVESLTDLLEGQMQNVHAGPLCLSRAQQQRQMTVSCRLKNGTDRSVEDPMWMC